MGSSFFQGIYRNDPLAHAVGLTAPQGPNNDANIPIPAYSGVPASLAGANSGYGTGNLPFAGQGGAPASTAVAKPVMPTGAWGIQPPTARPAVPGTWGVTPQATSGRSIYG